MRMQEAHVLRKTFHSTIGVLHKQVNKATAANIVPSDLVAGTAVKPASAATIAAAVVELVDQRAGPDVNPPSVGFASPGAPATTTTGRQPRAVAATAANVVDQGS